MRRIAFGLLCLLLLPQLAQAQGTVPTFKLTAGAATLTVAGKAPADAKYRLRNPKGYSGLIGAMFWTLNYDRYDGYNYSNMVGPQLHGYPR